MDTLTHALAPVIIVKLCTKRAEDAGWRVLLPIAGAGALPDLLNPHLSLEARVASWSHGLPCWALVTMIFMLGSMLMARRFRLRTALACSAAYLFHLFCDAISGGINWFSPFGTFQWGEYWVSPLLWIPLDVICVLVCYYLFRLAPVWRKRRAQGG
ncbi:metal-dependent hydrolase [Luteolibacter sp. SL250]|uniref:metal-dependent hydrolase n=1 Tax=Luteolibacter sp. SL250 TaxID=2995170 RepID=UPI00226EDFF8|nr:metal-dependent hydrolase [Luteolibacter sp. SL250]WAC19986.1 metal-dependent hydrolase [Luteolibacter sp. SL250]